VLNPVEFFEVSLILVEVLLEVSQRIRVRVVLDFLGEQLLELLHIAESLAHGLESRVLLSKVSVNTAILEDRNVVIVAWLQGL